MKLPSIHSPKKTQNPFRWYSGKRIMVIVGGATITPCWITRNYFVYSRSPSTSLTQLLRHNDSDPPVQEHINLKLSPLLFTRQRRGARAPAAALFLRPFDIPRSALIAQIGKMKANLTKSRDRTLLAGGKPGQRLRLCHAGLL